MSTPSQILDPIPTRSPYWLRINGIWVHLEGVSPGVEVARNRAANELVTVDGYRYVQQAPRAPRDWNLSYTWATPAAIAALQVAVDLADVWLWDQTAAAANMLDARFHLDDGGTGDGPVTDCGGIPVHALTVDATAAVFVRGGMECWLTSWGEEPTQLTDAADPPEVLASSSGGQPVAVTSEVDLQAVLTCPAGSAGTMVSTVPPARFTPGRGTPCAVAVSDPAETLNRWVSDSVAYADATVTVKEVGNAVYAA